MAWLGTWTKRVKLTIDQTDIDATLANFPILVHLSIASGRFDDDVSFVFDELQNDTNRKKIAITKADGTTQCYVEIEKWDDANEHAWLWVKVPSIAADVDTDLYLYYDITQADNTAYVGDPNSTPAENVWDTNFRFVSHMRDDPDTSHIRDSTANNNDGAKVAANRPVITTAGKIDGAQDFEAGTSDYITVPRTASLEPANITLEAWTKAESWPGWMRMFNKGILDSPYPGYAFLLGPTYLLLQVNIAGTLQERSTAHGTSAGEEHHFAVVYDGSNIIIYKDGSALQTWTGLSGSITHATAVALRLGTAETLAQFFDGILDEMRISGVGRTVAWLKATYETGRDDLLDFGTEELLPVVPTVTTQDADEVTSTSAKLHGTITNLNGGGDCDERGFDWDLASYKISVNTAAHTDYGLVYPATYKFSIPAASANLHCYRRNYLTDAWTEFTVKTAADFFNGIECVRFDYTNNFAYVSVAFSPATDNIYILFRDAVDAFVVTAFVSICAYYDNRKAVVTATGDDIHNQYLAAKILSIQNFQARHIWQSLGFVTASEYGITWSTFQSLINAGYLEAASHSRTHPSVPYGDYDSEIEGSKQDIIGNLDLPALYKKGATEHVPAWPEPYGTSDATARTQLGSSKYLCDRTVDEPVHIFATWDATNGLYNRVGYSDRLEDHTAAYLNALFDIVYNAGGIYHLMYHPSNISSADWDSGGYAHEHLDYIQDKKDVWYVGFGALYMYHYVQERGQVTVTTYGSTYSWTEGTPGVYVYGVGTFEHTISSLYPDTWYQFRAKAHNATGWGYGGYKLVHTSPATPHRSFVNFQDPGIV